MPEPAHLLELAEQLMHHHMLPVAQLESGTAEIFGAELALGVSVNVTGQKLAVS